LIAKLRKLAGMAAGILLLMGSFLRSAQMPRVGAAAASDSATQERITRYIREKFGYDDTVKMTVWPLRSFSNPDFYKTNITLDYGKAQETLDLFLTKDRRYLIMAKAYALNTDPKNEIADRVREVLKFPAATTVAVGPFRVSTFPGLLATAVSVDDGKRKRAQDFYVTKDSRFFFLGSVYDMTADPRREALRTISTANQPSQGRANAPVTIVEYTDLQCASCARVHAFLEKELLPKYADKVRVVYKEFPLPGIHDWALTGSIATQCAYQISPAAFVPYRSLIFQHQAEINATNSRDLLIQYGEQVGIDRLRLAACIDSKATLPRVEANFHEGQAVGVVSTPTSFVNGKMLVGMPSPDTFYRAIDEALRRIR